ncbi:uncharacterized protein TNCV_20361 [Trichonephila clavipes]|nr:uncharacterized protein TNCV_20361 [Trichonephila clavipes]
MMWFVREEFFSGSAQFEDFKIISSLSSPGISGRPFSIQLHPDRGGKGFFVGQRLRGRSQAGTHNNFQNAAAKRTCDDYFHKEADSQLGDGNRYNVYASNGDARLR